MTNKKPSKKYYFSVEGETEQWYLYWLRDLINSIESSEYKIIIDCKIETNPIKRVKGLVITGKTEIYHFSDYESDEDNHVCQFKNTMDSMKDAMRLGKDIRYRFGYSNLTFDLWIILHKMDCLRAIEHRKKYIKYINQAYEENFQNMAEFKREKNFKRCLEKITLEDVTMAIKRGETIRDHNVSCGYVLNKYKGFSYYKENPSLDVWESIKKILTDCKLL